MKPSRSTQDTAIELAQRPCTQQALGAGGDTLKSKFAAVLTAAGLLAPYSSIGALALAAVLTHTGCSGSAGQDAKATDTPMPDDG